MLGATYRAVIYNTTGQTLAANAVTIKPRRWKIGTDGSLTLESSGTADILSQTGTLATATYLAGTTQDNTTNKYFGAELEITVTAPTSASGNVVVWLQRSVDGGTTWPDNGEGEHVATFAFTTSGTKRQVAVAG